MQCLSCQSDCGTRDVPMNYLFVKNEGGERVDAEPFCSQACALVYAQQHPTLPVPRCAVCGDIIVNAAWYASLSDDRPRHYECMPGAEMPDELGPAS